MMEWKTDDAGELRALFEHEGRTAVVKVRRDTRGRDTNTWSFAVEIAYEGKFQVCFGGAKDLPEAKQRAEGLARRILAGRESG
jgi:hypothetical protein